MIKKFGKIIIVLALLLSSSSAFAYNDMSITGAHYLDTPLTPSCSGTALSYKVRDGSAALVGTGSVGTGIYLCGEAFTFPSTGFNQSGAYIRSYDVADGTGNSGTVYPLTLVPAPPTTLEIGTIGTNPIVGASGTGTGVLGALGTTSYNYGFAIVIILGSVIAIGLAYLVFRFGWRKVKKSTK